jgi:hypothetical protein
MYACMYVCMYVCDRTSSVLIRLSFALQHSVVDAKHLYVLLCEVAGVAADVLVCLWLVCRSCIEMLVSLNIILSNYPMLAC